VSGDSRELPSGFVALDVGASRAVCAVALSSEIRELLGRGTLYEFAASSANARAIAGRGAAYVASLGIPTPVILAYATYPAAAGFWRADVMTRYVAPSADLAAVLLSNDGAMRADAWEATALLVREMSAAGIRHHDLNAKNILLDLRNDGPSVAMLLDVDRVVFDEAPGRARDGNLSRLFRSFRKWRSLYGARVEESEIDALARRVRELTAAPSMTRS